jgi:hypothetical protein
MASKATPLIPFQGTTGALSSPTLVAADHSLLELDSELDALLDQIQDEIEEHGEASAEAMERFQVFCQAMDVKIDRIGRFLRIMETRAEHCKKESATVSVTNLSTATVTRSGQVWSGTALQFRNGSIDD